MQKNKCDIVISFAATSEKELLGVRDLLESIKLYFPQKNACTIIVDNSVDANYGLKLKSLCSKYDRVEIIANKTKQKLQGGLYYTISGAMLHAINGYQFKIFAKIDTDSLFTGAGLEKDAIEFFNKNPEVGLLGAYKHSPTGAIRDFSGWAKKMERDIVPWKKYLDKLKNEDYITAEHAQGGGCIFSERAIKELANQNLLALEELRIAGVAEDVTFSTITRYAGFKIADFVADHQPLAVSFRGLPYSVFTIRKKKKKLVHSLKFRPKDQLRRLFFRICRSIDKLRSPSTINPKP